MSNTRVHRITYTASGRTYPMIFQVRDGAAYCEASAPLNDSGFQYGEMIHLYPEEIYSKHHAHEPDLSFIQDGDVLIQTIRPPTDLLHRLVKGDASSSNQKHGARSGKREDNVKLSGTDIEAKFGAEIAKCLSICSRAKMVLSENASAHLLEGFQDWADLQMRVSNGAEIQKHQKFTGSKYEDRKNRPPFLDAAYFLNTRIEINGCACRYILSFGMGGIQTLVWNRILRIRRPKWLQDLDQPDRFVVALLDAVQPDDPPFPSTLQFADDYDFDKKGRKRVKVILDWNFKD